MRPGVGDGGGRQCRVRGKSGMQCREPASPALELEAQTTRALQEETIRERFRS